MNAALALVRHGQTDWNLAGRLQGQTDIPLNETGRQQANEVGLALAEQGWDLVVASPLSRAQQSAQLIAEVIGAENGPVLDEIVERNFGPLEGQCRGEMDELEVQRLLEQAEPRLDVLHRAVPALLDLVGKNPGRRILCVSHGATMRIVRDALAGFRKPEGVENGEIIVIDLLELDALAQRISSGELLEVN